MIRTCCLALTLIASLTGCTLGGSLQWPGAPTSSQLEAVATFVDYRATGVGVSSAGRLFVCFPRWADTHDLSVAEILSDGALRAYPDQPWNTYLPAQAEHAGTQFVCVQSVVVDDEDQLWVLDPAAPKFEGPVSGGPKLVSIDLSSDSVKRIYPLSSDVAPPGSYLNDIRIDTQRRYAYITDSGLGAIVVVNLETGSAQRLLEDHPSTKAERDAQPVIGGKVWRRNGKTPRIHADGIALAPDGQWLYYHALTGYRLYRVPTAALREGASEPNKLADAVEDLGPTAVTDGMLIDRDGNIYHTALEYDAILKRRPNGELTPLVIDSRLQWPDTLALGPNGKLYITTAQIHLNESQRTQPFTLWRVDAEIKR